MKSVLRRTAYAERYAAQRARKAKDSNEGYRLKQLTEQHSEITQEFKEARKRERRRRRDDYQMGQLSPWRENMPNMLESGFGLWTESAMRPAVTDRATWEQLKPGRRVLAVGDRVCVVDGHESLIGQIGKIKEFDEERGTFVVESVNNQSYERGAQTRVFADNNDATRVDPQTSERPFLPHQLQLVYPLPNPETGRPEDCLLEGIVCRNKYYDRYDCVWRWERWLEPQHIRIPWPPEEVVPDKETESDTPRIRVDDASFLPRLLSPPMPGGVINELRNQYSKFRTRHEDWYIAKMTAIDEAADHEKARKLALLPQGARNIARVGRAKTPVDGAPPRVEMSDELAAAIGAHMEEAASKTAASPSSSTAAPTS